MSESSMVLSVNHSISRIISLVKRLVPNLDIDSHIEQNNEDVKVVSEIFTWSNEDDTVTSGGNKSTRVSLLVPT